MQKTRETNIILPTLPLRDVVVYPHMVIPLFVGREKSVNALNMAMAMDKSVFLTAQKSADIDDPGESDIHDIGTIANILQLLKLPDDTVKVLVEGRQRAFIHRYVSEENCYISEVIPMRNDDPIVDKEIDILMRSILVSFEEYIKLNKRVPREVLTSLVSIESPGQLADTIAAHMAIKLVAKQKVLEINDCRDRITHLLALIEGENDVLHVEKRIRSRVKQQMEKSQREYYLNEQMKAIQKELGDLDDAPSNEIDDLGQRIEKAGMSKEAKAKAVSELNKLKMMSPMSAEATVVRNYIDCLVSLPWRSRTKVRHDLAKAEAVLEADHYGLETVKERILEYLAVQQRAKKPRGPILCLVGPPGVGKTSLGQSVARATNRKFTRMSLGGVRDEAEIRGHRRTYIGSLPGKIIQNLSKVGSKNPLFLLDEIDKMSMDFRGDPSSALLEVLDPEQNAAFSDHYLEIDFNLSEVIFVATANSLNIPDALLDRMEVIRIPGYTEDEKLKIATRYLIPKQRQQNGLHDDEIVIADSTVLDIIRFYTREAGVRGLEREISKVSRKIVKSAVMEKQINHPYEVDSDNLSKYLGVRKFRYGIAEEQDQVGQVTGLAWTEVGGELLTVEAAPVPGKGKLTYTGRLGDVMQESIQAAVTVVRSRAASLGIDADFHQKYDLHIHVPEGATPKDGPSAGITMCVAIVSSLTRIPVKAAVAMTGEITLRGQVLPIGGLKEKLLAAHRGGIKIVVIPEDNRKDLQDIPPNILEKLQVFPVRWIDEVLEVALQSRPVPRESNKPSVHNDGDESNDAIRAH